MRKKTSENKTQEISIGIPPETLEALEKIARQKELPLKALLKLYIGQGLRQGLTQDEVGELALKRMKSRKETANKPAADLAA